MEPSDRSPARLLAPIALVVFGICVLVILGSAGGSDKSSSQSGPTKAERRDLKLERRKRERERKEATPTRSASVYVVRSGDTLGGIAARTGVSVEKLQELNPTLDPQALQSGQRVKLK